jgi:hypothetical protein
MQLRLQSPQASGHPVMAAQSGWTSEAGPGHSVNPSRGTQSLTTLHILGPGEGSVGLGEGLDRTGSTILTPSSQEEAEVCQA